MNEVEPSTSNPSRYEKKRSDILRAAARLVNEKGVKGMTFVEVANDVGLNTTSVTYYFRRKEALVEAVYAETMDRLEIMATEALAEADPRARVRHFVDAHVDLRASIRDGRAAKFVTLSEMRTLSEATRLKLEGRYRKLFAQVRNLFGEPGDGVSKLLANFRTYTLLEALYWMPYWSPGYALEDFGRVKDRLFDLLENGLAPTALGWQPEPLRSRANWRRDKTQTLSPRDEFLRVATRVINQRGYKGASVNQIASALNVTKGSFYHHHDAKDALVLDCFDASCDRFSAAQFAALDLPGSYWTKLISAMAELVDLQFYDPMPLMRSTALQALPTNERDDVLQRSDRIARRFAGMLMDGVAEGSVRACDADIASQCLTACVNSANDLSYMTERIEDRDELVRYYLWPMLFGLFTDLPD